MGGPADAKLGEQGAEVVDLIGVGDGGGGVAQVARGVGVLPGHGAGEASGEAIEGVDEVEALCAALDGDDDAVAVDEGAVGGGGEGEDGVLCGHEVDGDAGEPGGVVGGVHGAQGDEGVAALEGGLAVADGEAALGSGVMFGAERAVGVGALGGVGERVVQAIEARGAVARGRGGVAVPEGVACAKEQAAELGGGARDAEDEAVGGLVALDAAAQLVGVAQAGGLGVSGGGGGSGGVKGRGAVCGVAVAAHGAGLRDVALGGVGPHVVDGDASRAVGVCGRLRLVGGLTGEQGAGGEGGEDVASKGHGRGALEVIVLGCVRCARVD